MNGKRYTNYLCWIDGDGCGGGGGGEGRDRINFISHS